MRKLGIYIHIPFCERKCDYCGFLSFSGCDDEVKNEYMEALGNELKYRLELVGASSLKGEAENDGYEIDTVFIGGGTPSVANLGTGTKFAFSEIWGQVLMPLLTKDCEITIEANPGTLTREKLENYRKMGINRLSMGVQSFDDEMLKKLGRIHNVKQVYENFELARECGFENINLDLMFALPGQTLENWEKSLNEAIKLNTEHISFYSLQLEENTPFFKAFQEGKLRLASDELDRSMYHRAVKLLKEAGYKHYEISNAAAPSNDALHNYRICKHNYKYWSMDEYIGVGLGASSFYGGARFMNIADLREYINLWSEPQNVPVAEGLADGEAMKKGTAEWHDNKLHDFASEFVFTGLRKTAGIDLAEFEARYGVGFFEYFEGQEPYVRFCISQGLMAESEDGRYLRLTEKGIDTSNSIMVEFV
jgi:oxygen-independent coproporphyrinogen-3 oxidase